MGDGILNLISPLEMLNDVLWIDKHINKLLKIY